VYEGQVGDQTEIWTVGSDGSTPRRLTNSEIDEKDPSWSRDGQSIFYVALVDGQETIRRLPAAGGESVLVVSAGGREPVQSADGQRLYFVRNGGLFAGALTAPDPPLLADGSLVRLGKELKIGGHSQLDPTAVTIPADTADAAMALDQLDLSTGRIERVVQLDAATASAATGIAISPAKRYLSVVFDQGSIGELTTVEGWRLKPFSEYMIDRFYLEGVLYPQRWWRMMRDKYKD
jgi:dipeptidyl aminopeptidase/acylaminoacyl peptidase